MYRFWFTWPNKGKGIYTDNYEFVKGTKTLHSFIDIGDALNYLGQNIQSNSEWKILKFLNELKKNPNQWYDYDIEKLDKQ